MLNIVFIFPLKNIAHDHYNGGGGERWRKNGKFQKSYVMFFFEKDDTGEYNYL